MSDITEEIIDVTDEIVWEFMPHRIEDSHKGTYGKLLCAAGSTRYRGAAALCTEGALRAGCGIVTLASVEPVYASVQPRLPECVFLPCRASESGCISSEMAPELIHELGHGYTALLMGPGLGNTLDTVSLVRDLVTASTCAVVLDADALNALAPTLSHPIDPSRDPAYNLYTQQDKKADSTCGTTSYKVPGWPQHNNPFPMVITPHPGEMARLLDISVAEVKASKEKTALCFARDNNCVVVLKDHRTIIANPRGRIWRNSTGNSGLARGGSGDILTGMIGSFLALGMDPSEAAVCAVWLHGAAADRCAQRCSETGMLPHDIFDDLKAILLENGR